MNPSCFQCKNQSICKHYATVSQLVALIKKQDDFIKIPELVAKHCELYKDMSISS